MLFVYWVFLNNLAIIIVSFPKYVNIALFVLGVVFCFFWVLHLSMCVANSYCFVVFFFVCCSSWCLFSFEMGYVFILLIRYLMAEYL
jgi:hypothetical protein